MSCTKRRRSLRWGQYLLLFLLFLTAWSCRKKPVKTTNVPGSILVMYPVTEQERLIKKNIKLKLKLYDIEKLAHIKAVLQKHTIFEKWFPPNKYSELMLEETIDLKTKELHDGRTKLLITLKDQAGSETQHTLDLFIDRKGPSIDWIEPKPGQTLTEISSAELKVNDVSGIDSVKIMLNNKPLRTFHEAPFQFPLDPSEYPSGNLTFWVHAKDKLGNVNARAFSFLVLGSDLGAPCSTTESCKRPMVCVRYTGDVRGICRKTCRRQYDCESGERCQIAGQFRICAPPLKRSRTQQIKTVGLLDGCGRGKPCERGMVCIFFPDQGASCRKRCEDASCPEGWQCKEVAWTAAQTKVKVCLRPPSSQERLQQIGQICGPGQPCVKEGMCVQAGNTAAKCLKICGSDDDCPSGVSCSRVPGKSQKVCANTPSQGPPAGAYEQCGPRKACARGLNCISSTRNPKPLCFPSCGSSYCASESLCLPIAGRSICLTKCNPNESQCPSGTGCRFYLLANQKGGYVCN